MLKDKEVRFCGREFSDEELGLIRETVRDCSGLSRTELAYTICELLDWKRPTGRLKGRECHEFLEGLESAGVIQLPDRQGPLKKPRQKIAPASPAEVLDHPLLEGRVKDVAPVGLELLKTSDDRKQWREWVGRHHYLGCKVPFGAHLRYFVTVSPSQPVRVGCVQVSSPSWRMAVRDQWIGWNDEQRVQGLQQIVQNSRFLLLPWVRIPHLASAALSRLARVIADDWEAHYAIRPVLLETLVDRAHFKGTCYRAANWIPLGETSGRGRMDEGKIYGLVPKEVLVYPLHRRFRERLMRPPEPAPMPPMD
ncbi:MAG: DUF4338 domain-containing protein [Syntrophobacteraceae bacterium]|nr:DUF4338 domain-containing protein [Syntrophobacteraceae bacterium]